MSHNRLYCLIYDGKTDTALPPHTVEFQRSMQGAAYALHHLPITGVLAITDEQNTYQLGSHHLSFYETIDKRYPELSEYHYTAVLKDQNNFTYRLHVYFDHTDQLTKEPVLDKLSNGIYTRVACNHQLLKNFTQFALAHSTPTINKLRQQQTTLLQTLENNYKAAEQKLSDLSRVMVNNPEDYLQQVSITRDTLQPLARYSYNSYEALYLLLSRLKKISATTTPLPSVHDETNEIQAPMTVSIAPTCTAMAPTLFKARQLPKPSASELIEKTVEAATRFEQTNSESDIMRVPAFLIYYQNTHEALLLIENGNYHVTLRELQTLHSHLAKITQQGSELLTNLLLRSHFDEAKNLIGLAIPTPTNLIKMAFQIGNAPLLDFLITHYSLPLNTFSVQGNLNPIQYCFTRHSEKSSKEALFAVLVKQGASTLAPAEDGLPIAHHIINKHAHPFQRALLDHTKDYGQLIKQISAFLKGLPSSEDLESAINAYSRGKGLLASVQTGNKKIDSLTTKLDGHTCHNLTKKFKEEMLVKIKGDKEIISHANLYLLTLTSYTNLLPPREKKQLLASGREAATNSENFFTIPEGMDYSTAKQNVIEIYSEWRQILNLKIELLTVQKKLRSSVIDSKKWKKANKQQHKLIAEISEKAAPYEFLLADMGSSVQEGSKTISGLLGNSHLSLRELSDSPHLIIELYNALRKLDSHLPKAEEETENSENEPNNDSDSDDYATQSSSSPSLRK